MNATKLGFAAGLVIAFTGGSEALYAASMARISGSLVGSVKNAAGVPQMGATVMLFNRNNRLIEKALTNTAGAFGFDSLPADFYSVRVNLVSFVPAIRDRILVQPGMQSVLAINLAGVLSSIELIYTGPANNALITEDWKRTLQSSMTTRPVLRFLPGGDARQQIGISRSNQSATIFSDTYGLLSVSSGEGSPFSSVGNQPDLGTSFALATSVFGANQLKVSGNIGYAANASSPAAGFGAAFSRRDAPGSQVKLMMQQLTLPRAGAATVGGQSAGAPSLRTMSITVVERAHLADHLHLDYGASLESVTYLDRLNYVSPFALLGYEMGQFGTVQLGYSAGAPPVELMNRSAETHSSLQHDLAALSVFPRVSIRNGRAEVQRARNFEIGYRVRVGKRTFSAGAYHEVVSNGALTVSGDTSLYGTSDLLPELSSNSSVFNIGRYSQFGYTASVAQELGDHLEASVAAGSGGVFYSNGVTLQTSDADELRELLLRGQRAWVRARLAGVVPKSGTRFSGSYEWTDYRTLTPGHIYLTQDIYPEAGLNVRLRQPIPAFGPFPGRFEASADLRNLLAQGYLPVSTTDGRSLIITRSPRAVRGGVSFIF